MELSRHFAKFELQIRTSFSKVVPTSNSNPLLQPNLSHLLTRNSLLKHEDRLIHLPLSSHLRTPCFKEWNLERRMSWYDFKEYT